MMNNNMEPLKNKADSPPSKLSDTLEELVFNKEKTVRKIFEADFLRSAQPAESSDFLENEDAQEAEIEDEIAPETTKFIDPENTDHLESTHDNLPKLFISETKKTVLITSLPFHIGRTSSNDLSIPLPSVSAHHADIYSEEGKYWIKDLGSCNGVILSGKNVQTACLKHRDEIKIGKQTLIFLYPETERFYLMFLGGKQDGEKIFLSPSRILKIGRQSSCDIPLEENGVSKQHASIEYKDGKYILKDLQSKNGTFFNGLTVTSAALLYHSCQIQIGSQTFVFCDNNLPYQRPIPILTPSRKSSSKFLSYFTTVAIGISLILMALIPVLTSNPSKPIEKNIIEQTDNINTEKNIIEANSSSQNVPTEFPKEILSNNKGSFPNNNTPNSTPAENISSVNNNPGDDYKLLEECRNLIQEHILYQNYTAAIEVVENYRKKLSIKENFKYLDNWQKQIQEETIEFKKLIDTIQKYEKNIIIDISKPGQLLLKIAILQNKKVNEKEIYLEIDGEANQNITWQELAPSQFCEILEQTNFCQMRPEICALWMVRHNLYRKVEQYLIAAWQQEKNAPEQKKLAEFYCHITQQKMPPEGLIVFEGRFVDAAEFRKWQKQQQQALLTQKQSLEKDFILKEREKSKDTQSQKYQREHAEFQLHYDYIDSLTRVYDYPNALEKFIIYYNQLECPEIKEKVQYRISQIRPMSKLFNRLIIDINQKQLQDDRIEFSPTLSGQIAWANNEQFKIKLPKGEIRHHWYELKPQQMYTFFKRMKLGTEELFCLGVFSFEHDLFTEGNRCFISVIRDKPQKKPEIDSYLSKKLGIDIPEGGFVPYQDQLISKNEADQRRKGLVRYQGQWVTPEEKTQLSQGKIKHDNKWITQQEKDLLEKGYIKYQEKWYSKDELEKLRNNWDNAWELETTNYSIKTNISEDFIKELGKFMEAACKEYKNIFGRPCEKRMKIFAFRTYEDYRNYCLKFNNVAQLRAGGFANSLTNTGVAWLRDPKNIRSILEPLIHEGAHLYQFNSCPRLRAPSWYAEALATQFEGFDWDGESLIVHSKVPSRLSWLQDKFRNKQYIPLAEFLKENGLELVANDPEKSAIFYAQSWGLFYYLHRTIEEKYRTKFQKFVKQMNNGDFYGKEHEAFEEVFKDELAKLEADWIEYICSLN